MSKFKLQPDQPVPPSFTFRYAREGYVILEREEFLPFREDILRITHKEREILMTQREEAQIRLDRFSEEMMRGKSFVGEEYFEMNRLQSSASDLLPENYAFMSYISTDDETLRPSEFRVSVAYLKRLFEILHAEADGLPYPHRIPKIPPKPSLLKRLIEFIKE
tara:strand:- start:222 stop:710 length:489 start_codon:yes stop_codon:yes gene_type:complete